MLVRSAGPWLLVLGGTSVAGAALQLALPYAIGRTLDDLTAPGHWLEICVVLVAGITACESLGVWAAGVTGTRTAAALRRQVADRLLGAGPAITRRFPEGDLVTRLELNAEEAGQAPDAVVSAITLLLPTAGGVVALVLIDPWMAATLLAGLLLIALALRAFFRDTTTIAAGYQEAQADIAGRLIDALRGARTIAAAHTADVEARRILSPLPRLRAHGLALWRTTARAGVQTGVAVPLLEIAVLGVGGLRLAAGGITVGQLYAAARYAVLGAGLSSALGHLGRLARARSAARRVAEVLTEPPVPHGPRALPAGPGTLEFAGVVLPGETAPIDLVVPGGTSVAVVGRSGSGKSRLAAVAARLVDPDAGAVLLDGVPLPELTGPALRAAVGVAFERPVLVGETVAEAITLGRGPERLAESAAAARADTFIRPLPQGYATALADAPLSGGERQRLGLARAFAHGDRLLVLDDATSSLDTITERQVATALTGPLGGRTRLIVTHRAGTAARADRVLWLADGKVRGYAPHRDLWPDPGYRAVFASQEPAS
jgi:ATP-binding cassette subfamily B protein